MKSEHIDVVTLPWNVLSVARQHQTREVINRTRGRMFTRNPFRINQCQGTRLHRNNKMPMQNFARRVGQIQVKLDGLVRLREGTEGEQRDRKNAFKEWQQNILNRKWPAPVCIGPAMVDR